MKKTKLTEEQIVAKVAELKKQHNIKSVFVIQTEDKTAFLKQPSRDQLKYGAAAFGNDPLGMTEHVLECGWLDGDEEIKKEDRYFLAISAQVDEIIETAEVEIKKY